VKSHGTRERKGFLTNGGEQQEIESRDERALKRASIVEKWWHDKIKKATRQSKNLRKEEGLGEIEERHMEELYRMKR
jgi:hypothetical protein